MNSSAIRLRLLGAPVLLDADGTPAGGAAQPHRIALLALLALHPNRTVGRAELTAWLWPGFDQKEANQLLNKELFSLNKALGDDAIFSNAKEVRLGSRVTVDALDFQSALDEGRPGDAMELYTGPLLDDFLLDDSPEFQGWAADQRANFAAARKSLRPIAEAAAEAQRETAERTPDAEPEVAKPRPRVGRKRPKPPPEPPPAAPPQEPPVEESRAPAPPPLEITRASDELVREAPVASEEPPPEAPSVADESSTEMPTASAQPTSDVFWAREATLEVGRAAQDESPPAGHASQEIPTDVERIKPPPSTHFASDFAPPPPPIAPKETEPEEAEPEDAEPVVWYDPESGPPVAETPSPSEFAEPEAYVPPIEPPPAPEPPARPAQREPARAVRRRRIRIRIPLPSARLVLTVLVIALAGGTAYLARGRIADTAARARSTADRIISASDRARSVAVLPIDFIARDPEDQLLAAGIGRELRRMLTETGLRVTPGDVFEYRTPPYHARSIAETLGVAYVLQGAMQREDTMVRFRFQLVNGADGAIRWDQTYAPRLADIMVLEEDVAISVTRRILEKPPTFLPRRETRSGAAYELVLRASDPALLRSDSDARHGLELFQRAVALDSGYARAWAGLARMSVRTAATLGTAERDRQLALANRAAQRAVALNDSLGEAHAAAGLARSALFDMAGAETQLQRALQLDSSRASHEALVDLYLWSGRHDQALAIAQRALERDPRSPYAHADVARVLQIMNRCDEAVTHLNQIATGNRPTRAAETRALCHAQAGQWNQAVAAARTAITPSDSSSVSLLAFLLQRAGNGAEAERLRDVVNDRLRRGLASAVDLALLDAGARNFDAAAARARDAVDARSFVMAPGASFVTLTAPLFQELHRRPAFAAARKRLGFR